MQQLSGTVLSLSSLKTVKVQVVRRWTHPLYHKTLTKKKNYLVHCELDVQPGDKVILGPIRPMSKMKKWQLVKKL
ncbi:mitochondrial small ribosomal subunit protein uS17m [Patescibacteria group bacterium]|nr:mitochondrial small ribosomal subunit protein uS17m [Patescibacteria group bacterium]